MGMLVFLIVPGIGLLYGGLTRRKSALAMVFQGLVVQAMVSFQWTFWGFTLAFSRTGGPFIGDMSNFGMIDVRTSFGRVRAQLIRLDTCRTLVGLRRSPGHRVRVL